MANRRREGRSSTHQSFLKETSFPPAEFYESGWPDDLYLQPDVEPFVVPPSWDGTAMPMPDASDLRGWLNVLDGLEGIEEMTAIVLPDLPVTV